MGESVRGSRILAVLSPAQAGDGAALVALRIEAMRESLQRADRFDAARARERFLSGFSPDHTRHIEFDGEKVGFVVVKPHGQGLLLDHLYIHPKHQRQGIGAAVLAQVFAEADAAGAALRVGALRGSDSNRFYARHGFALVEEAEFDNYYVRPPSVVMPPPLRLVWPSAEYLPGYVAALERGWSADNVRGKAAADEELDAIRRDGEAFLARLVDHEAKGADVTLPDGSTVPRLPGYRRWLWDGEFCGAIGLRWQHGTEALPPHCLGHIGYAVVPWKRGLGYATRALGLLLPGARAEGLRFVEITTDPENMASQRVIEANGGRLHERFVKPAQFGGLPGLRYRIALEAAA
jgi:predicted acetyltransferase/GNAT superfamily N-acetyltransferase